MRKRLKALVKVQNHHTLTNEIRKYLANAPGESSGNKDIEMKWKNDVY